MESVDWKVGVQIIARSFTIQGSWNYRTMQGSGLAFALLPALRNVHGADEAALARAVARYARFYNGHPYLSTVALGALARLETEKAAEETAERLKTALASPLGTLGDRLVWARWRPIWALAALLIFAVGAPWWVAGLVFLIPYNALHLALRVWGLRIGWREGREVGRALVGSPLRRVPDRLTIPLAVVAGAMLPPTLLALSGAIGYAPTSPVLLGVAALVVFGAWQPAIAGRLASGAVVALSLALATFGLRVW